MARAPAEGPTTRMEKEIKKLIALARIELNDCTQEDLSVALGCGKYYLRDLKRNSNLIQIPLPTLILLAMLAKQEIRFVGTS